MNKPRKAVIRNGKIIYGDDINAELVKPNETAARYRRETMKNNNRKEMLQRNQTDYYRAYPEQLDNLSDDLKRQLS